LSRDEMTRDEKSPNQQTKKTVDLIKFCLTQLQC